MSTGDLLQRKWQWGAVCDCLSGKNVTIDAYDGVSALEGKLLSILSGASVKLNGEYPVKACFVKRNQLK